MRYPTPRTALLCFIALTIISGCRPRSYDTEPSAISCPTAAEVYGYRGSPVDSATSCTYGKINTSTAGIAGIAPFTSHIQFSQGAYHIGENNYYVFKATDTARTLLRISSAGAVTPLTNSAYGSRFDGLVYNRFNGKLYCFRTAGGTSHIAEITVSGSTYTTADLATTLLPEMHDNATVDASTGDIYYQSFAGSMNFNVEKYHPGGAVTTVATGMPTDLWGMRYNPNDNNLYAVRAGTTFEFVKINSSGVLSVLSSLPQINFKKFSATFDPCTDHYILSFQQFSGPFLNGHLMQMSTTGAVLQHDSMSTVYMGLDVKY